MQCSELRIERRVSATRLWFGLQGDLDLWSVGGAATVLHAEIEGRSCDVDVDLSGLDFVGFAGIDMLVEITRQLRSEGRRVRLTATNRFVDRVVELAAISGRPEVRTMLGAAANDRRATRTRHDRAPARAAARTASPIPTG